MNLSAEASIQIRGPHERTFDYLTIQYPEFLDPWLIYPGIDSSQIEGFELEDGVRRHIALSDGGHLYETVDLHRPGEQHSYSFTGGVAFPKSMLVKGGAGDWRFTESGDGTLVIWHYEFELTSALWWPVGKVMMAGYGHWMARGLARAKELLEAE